MLDELALRICCPLSGEKLKLFVVERWIHPITKLDEVKSGYLLTALGGCYPIVQGIPRMLPEAVLVYKSQLDGWCPNFAEILTRINMDFGDIMASSVLKNKKIQHSFGFEWNLLRKNDQLKIWDLNLEEYKNQLYKELQLPTGFKAGFALDAGCGHGRSARLMADFCDTVIGAEVSAAVELAYEQNDKPNCHFIQADVHYLPFSNNPFDLLYSSGVLHHNPSTQKAFEALARHGKPGSLICIWLYHPFKNGLHRMMRIYRGITTRLSVQTVYYINSFTITPLQWLISQLTGKKKKWIEIAIEELDMLTPTYRHEHTPEEVKAWMNGKFTHIEITDTDDFGFSIKAIKQ